MTKVKGVALRTLPLFIQEKFGEESFQTWLKDLPEESKEIYENMVLAGSWYPIQDALVGPTIVMADKFYDGNVSKCAMESGRFSANFALTGIYKAFAKVSSIHFLIKKGSKIFSTYFDPALLEVVEEQKQKMVTQIKNFPDINEVIEYRIMGWMERGMEIGGCEKVKVTRTHSITMGHPYTELVFEWSGERKGFLS